MSNLLTRFLKNRNVEYSLLKMPEIWKEAFYKGLLLLLIVKLKADLYKFSYINSKLVRPIYNMYIYIYITIFLFISKVILGKLPMILRFA